MALEKTRAELDAQIDAGIKVNGNKEITPPIHNAIEKALVNSLVNKKEGGNVMQADFGQSAYIAPSQDTHFTPKKYIDDALLTVKSFTLWSSVTAYVAGDTVYNAGLIWYATAPNTNEVPSSGGNWSLLVTNTSAYDATGWNGSVMAPTQDAVRDEFEKKVSILTDTVKFQFFPHGLYLNTDNNAGAEGVLYLSATQSELRFASRGLLVDATKIELNSSGFPIKLIGSQIEIKSSGSYSAILKTTLLTTADREFQFPDSAGTLALTSIVSDTVYDATSWNGVTTIAPSKDAVRDKFEALGTIYLPLAGGIMSGAIDMGGNNINNGNSITAKSSTQTSTDANNKVVQNKILKVDTTGATPTELTTDGAAGSGSTNRISVPLNTSMSVVVNICVKQSGSANSKQMLRQFLVVNNAGTTTIEGAVTLLGTDVGSVALTAAAVTITANNTDDCIKVEGTGLAATNLRWTAYLVSTEVLYA